MSRKTGEAVRVVLGSPLIASASAAFPASGWEQVKVEAMHNRPTKREPRVFFIGSTPWLGERTKSSGRIG
jgi:hypothetical protein